MIPQRQTNSAIRPTPQRRARAALTLVELLVVIAILGVLAGLLLPSLSRAREKAKVARVRGELYNIGLALEMYSNDHAGKLPPVRVNCNSDLSSHWCELPVELARDGYLPHGNLGGREANLLDIFNPQHTYKYAAPGPQLLNGAPAGNYALWVPSNAPTDMSGGGKYFTDPKSSPVRWVVWSPGPRPASAKSLATYAPLTSDSWYRGAGDSGVIIRYADHDGTQFVSP
ncbi:MAG TPA: type II secretion system protein [Verrucomicrobiae bacterium]|nr:type II secretion system protein [Verrucomicrobiae bacterium]